MNKILLIIFCMICLVPTALAVPPFQESNLLGQLEVVVPKVEYVEYNKNFTFHIHAFNSTGHLITNTTNDCYLHVYNSTGNHLIEDVMGFDTNNFDFYTIINTTITDTKGIYGYVVSCNNTLEGGYSSGSFEVNDRSKALYTPDNTQGLSIVFFILFATLIMFSLPKIYGKFSEQPITEMIIVRGCYVIGFYLMVMNSGILSSIAVNAGYATGEIFRYMWFFGIGGYLLMVVTAIKTIFDITQLWKKQTMQKRGFE